MRGAVWLANSTDESNIYEHCVYTKGGFRVRGVYRTRGHEDMTEPTGGKMAILKYYEHMRP